MKGTYILLLKLEESVALRYGKKASHLEPGYYAYVGSAMGGFFKRIPRYFLGSRKKHWHIDYLLDHAQIAGLIMFSGRRIEEGISNVLSYHFEGIEGFGASDLRVKTNLYRVDPDKLFSLLGGFRENRDTRRAQKHRGKQNQSG
jgi:Uri superfamily endonuclease